MLDYLIIGSGLASSAFVELALKLNQKVLVFTDSSQHSSHVAGGLYNPVVLKRYTPTYQAKSQTEKMFAFYEAVEKKYGKKYLSKNPIYRKFASIEEQNNWFTASDQPQLKDFLEPKVHQFEYSHLPATFGFGKVNFSGWVDVKKYLIDFENHLKANDCLINESFEHNLLSQNKDFTWQYKTFKAKHIIFCEGFGLIKNPYFNVLPMVGTKGELLTIKAPQLNLKHLIKSNLFIIPLENDQYRVGATYEWHDKSKNPTSAGKMELIEELQKTINCDFEIINHEAEIRPTTKDRKPFVGEHPIYKNLYILNGLGTRGVVQAPDLADCLFQLIAHQIPLPMEIDIKRLRKIQWKSI